MGSGDDVFVKMGHASRNRVAIEQLKPAREKERSCTLSPCSCSFTFYRCLQLKVNAYTGCKKLNVTVALYNVECSFIP